MIRRITKELRELNLEFNPSGTYLFHKNGVEMKFTLPDDYPFKPPILEMLKPYEVVCHDVEWASATNLSNYIDENIEKIIIYVLEYGTLL